MKNSISPFSIQILKKNVTLIFLLVSIIMSCEPTEPRPSKTDQLCSGTWKLIDMQAKVNASFVSAYGNLPACFKDNIYSFKKEGTYEVAEGVTKCNVNDPDILEKGTWKFATNETEFITQSDAGVNTTYTIEVFDGTTLTGITELDLGAGQKATVKFIFKNQ